MRLLLGVLVLIAATVPAQAKVMSPVWGVVKEVRGTVGLLSVTVGQARDARVRDFNVRLARFVESDGSELKVGDFRVGDEVEIKLDAKARTVNQVRRVGPPPQRP